MDEQEWTGSPTSTCWNPCKQTGTYSKHADTEFLVYDHSHTCLYNQT